MHLTLTPRAEYHRLELVGITVLSSASELSKAGVGGCLQAFPTPALITGVAMGPVAVGVSTGPPAAIEEWEDVIEVPVLLEGDSTVIGGTQIAGVDVPWLGVPPGRHCMRVLSRGGDENYDLAVTEASQTIRIELVPFTGIEPRVLRLTSKRASAQTRVHDGLGLHTGGEEGAISDEEANLRRVSREHP